MYNSHYFPYFISSLISNFLRSLIFPYLLPIVQTIIGHDAMKIEDIYEFFNNPPPIYLNRELAVCYVLDVLLQKESYGTELAEDLTENYPSYRISDTVLYGALKFLEESGMIEGYWRKIKRRGRPRKMYSVLDSSQEQAQELAALWRGYLQDNCSKT